MSSQPHAGRSRIVAVAGAAGGAGQHIAEALLFAGFTVVLLLRKSNPDLLAVLQPFVAPDKSKDGLHAEVVDFLSCEHLTSVFKAHQVDTLISALSLHGDDWKIESGLLQAAVDAGLRRFAPSNLSIPVEASAGIRAYAYKRRIKTLCEGASISWTHFTPGIFMNYLGSNAPAKADGEVAVGHLNPLKFILDVEKFTGTIPATGDELVATTDIRDVGRGVAAACALEAPWMPHTGRMAGEILSYNEIVRLAERVRGRKFEPKYMSLEEIEKLCIPAPGMDGYEKDAARSTFMWEALRAVGQGHVVDDVGYGGLVEACAAEGIVWKPIGVQGFLEKWWQGV